MAQKKSIDHYFLNKDHAAATADDADAAAAAAIAVDDAAALPLPTQPNQTNACGEENVAVMEVDDTDQVTTAASLMDT